MKKFTYQKVVNSTAVVGLAVASTSAFANDTISMESATTQLGYALAAVGALGAAKMAPAALSWVWSLLTRVAQR
ncbi:hypothetical protein [Moraxella catarrhalis]|uniref:hypothetical protein n=1 Tax=Moraxella catarrhalis TaxID=480 RepID=UPI000EAA55D1|nr:hypothetical protein [Moraxella catarrhalis]RKL73265.1 hypothetical protein D6D66_08720 [Moraxella catarrhalis]